MHTHMHTRMHAYRCLFLQSCVRTFGAFDAQRSGRISLDFGQVCGYGVCEYVCVCLCVCVCVLACFLGVARYVCVAKSLPVFWVGMAVWIRVGVYIFGRPLCV